MLKLFELLSRHPDMTHQDGIVAVWAARSFEKLRDIINARIIFSWCQRDQAGGDKNRGGHSRKPVPPPGKKNLGKFGWTMFSRIRYFILRSFWFLPALVGLC